MSLVAQFVGCAASNSTKRPEATRLTGQLHPSGIGGLAFAQGSEVLVTLDGSGLVQFWDVASGKRLGTRFHAQRGARRLSVSQDGTLVLVWGEHLEPSAEEFVQLWDVASGKAIDVSAIVRPRLAMLSPDGKLMAVAARVGVAQIWDVQQRKLLSHIQAPMRGGRDYLHGFTADSGTLVTSSGGAESGGVVQLWDMGTWAMAGSLGMPSPCRAAAATTDRQWLAVWSYKEDGCRLHRLGTGFSNQVSNISGGVNNLAFTPDDKILVAALGARLPADPPAKGDVLGQLIFWDVQRHKRLQKTPVIDQDINRLAVSWDGKLAATSGPGVDPKAGSVIHLWPIPRP